MSHISPCINCLVISSCSLINRRYFPKCEIFLNNVNKNLWPHHYQNCLMKRSCPYCLSKTISALNFNFKCQSCNWDSSKLYGDPDSSFLYSDS